MSGFYNLSGKMENHDININLEFLNGKNFSENNESEVYFRTEFKHRTEVLIFYIIAYSVAFLFALFGNLVVIIVVLKYKWMHTVTNFFIVNLAIADILVAIFCLPITLLTHLFYGMYILLSI